MPRKRRSFTPEFKAEVVELIRSGGKSVPEVVRELGLAETAVRRWVARAEAQSPSSSTGALNADEREELRRLRRENVQLRQEREILKKATAFFAKESK